MSPCHIVESGSARTSYKRSRRAWEKAHGPIPPGLFVLHRCDVPACRNVKHLFLGTQTDNHRDMVSKGRHARGAAVSQPGERHGRVKLTEAQATEALFSRETSAAVARRFGVSRSAISDIRCGKNWAHLTRSPRSNSIDTSRSG